MEVHTGGSQGLREAEGRGNATDWQSRCAEMNGSP